MKPAITALGAFLVIATSTACSKGKEDARANQPGRPAAGTPVAADPAMRGGAGGPGGGGRRMSATLAPSDIATVTRQRLERGISITGDLRPIDRIDIRARLEGDLTGVYVREGQAVGAGTLLARFEASQQESSRASADADVAANRTDVQTAKWNLDQSRELFKEGAIPERDLKTAEQQLASAQAQLAAAQARQRTASQTFSDTRVVAPEAGVIETRSVAPGEHVQRGAELFTMVRTDVLELAAAVPSIQANDLRVGQTIRFSAANKLIIGRVARISPTVDPASRAVTVYVQFPNRDGMLRGGTFATGRLVVSTDTSALAVPSAAIRFAANTNEPFVYKIVSGTLQNTPVHVGYTDEAAGLVELLDGVKPGDKVVVGNVGTLGNGMKVVIVGGETNGRSGRPGR